MAQSRKIKTAIILAGGESKRFGSNKALAKWNGQTLIEHVVSRLSPFFGRILIVTKERKNYSFIKSPKVQLVEDLIPTHYSIGGLYSGLVHAKTEYAFVCGCDMPLLEPSLLESLWTMKKGYDAVVPVWEGRTQPLCAIYSSRCIEILRNNIEVKNLRIYDIFNHVNSCVVPEDMIRLISPAGLSFQDIDSIKDFKQILTSS